MEHLQDDVENIKQDDSKHILQATATNPIINLLQNFKIEKTSIYNKIQLKSKMFR